MTATETKTDGPRIYVASLSDYNAGRMVGAWIDVTCSHDATLEAITAMIQTSKEPNAEEWAIHDYEGWGPLQLGAWANLETLSILAAGIIEYGPAFAAWADNIGPDYIGAIDEFEEAFAGEWSSVVAYVEELLEDSGIYGDLVKAVGEDMARYCQPDLASFARDMELGGDIYTIDTPIGGVWVFHQ